jgi:hypothetical protein
MTVVLLAGLGTATFAGPASASYEDGICTGMPAPQTSSVGNLAPVLTNDTRNVVAGDLVALRPLANDSDPDGDKLYLVSASSPGRGEACVGSTGVLEYYAESSSTSYVQGVRYGVTDGDAYRTALVTFNVEGVAPLRAQLRKALGKGKPKRKAIVSFTNPNRRNVFLYAGNPKKARPTISRTVGAGQTIVVTTKLRRLQFVVARPTSDGDLSLVSFGLLNTRTGRQQTGGPEDFERSAPTQHTSVDRWLQ